jgi:pyrroline-5-carboxylate reductase
MQTLTINFRGEKKMDKLKGKIGFIGAGNMATALVKGIINSALYLPEQIGASDNDSEKLKEISDRFKIRTYSSNRDLVHNSAIILIAVKPQVIRNVLEEVKDEIRDEHLIISIAAGIPIKMIRSIIGDNCSIIRVMPNTPALIQKGMSALAAGGATTPDHMALANDIFNAVGKTVILDEAMIDAVTALSGSGPGFIFRIMECFVEAGEKIGFDREAAILLTTQTFLGAAQLADNSDQSLSRLREMVTSPGGTTEAGLASFERQGLSGIIQGGVEAAFNRSIELGKNY